MVTPAEMIDPEMIDHHEETQTTEAGGMTHTAAQGMTGVTGVTGHQAGGSTAETGGKTDTGVTVTKGMTGSLGEEKHAAVKVLKSWMLKWMH